MDSFIKTGNIKLSNIMTSVNSDLRMIKCNLSILGEKANSTMENYPFPVPFGYDLIIFD